MSYSPYQPPVPGPSADDHTYGSLKGQCTAIGVFYIVVAIIGLLTILFFGGANLVMWLTGNVQVPQGGRPGEVEGFYAGFVGTIILAGLSLILHPLIIYGGICMIRLRGRGPAKLASILMLIPLISPCCVGGIPFGIWGLIVLSRESTERYFP